VPGNVRKVAVLAVMGLAVAGCVTKTQQKPDMQQRESISYSCLSPSLTLNGNQIEAEFKVKLQGKDVRYSETCRKHYTVTGSQLDKSVKEGKLTASILWVPVVLAAEAFVPGLAVISPIEVCDAPERIAENTFVEEAQPAEGQFAGTLTIVNDKDPTEQHVKHLNGPVSTVTVPVASPAAGYLVHLRGTYQSEHLECDVDEQKLVEPGT